MGVSGREARRTVLEKKNSSLHLLHLHGDDRVKGKGTGLVVRFLRGSRGSPVLFLGRVEGAARGPPLFFRAGGEYHRQSRNAGRFQRE